MPDADDLSEDIQQKIREYGRFVDDVLKPTLSRAARARDDTTQERDEYLALRTDLGDLQRRCTSTDAESIPLLEMADLAHGRVFCDAEVDDPITVFVDVGFGFHVELQLEEALSFISQRIEFLSTKLMYRQEAVQRVTDHLAQVKDVLERLEECRR